MSPSPHFPRAAIANTGHCLNLDRKAWICGPHRPLGSKNRHASKCVPCSGFKTKIFLAAVGVYNGGLSADQIRRRVRDGRMTKLCGGVYCWGEPNGDTVRLSLKAHRPNLLLTGDTAVQVIFGSPITLPVHVAVPLPRQLTGTKYVSAHRISSFSHWHLNGAHYPPIPDLLTHCETDSLAIRFLDWWFSGRNGQEKLERSCAGRRLSAKAQNFISAAAIGADSAPERALVKRLRGEGFAVHSNVKIGDYFWDIVLPKHRIAIEVDGFEVHQGRAENHHTFARDRWKSNDATARGYLVFRYPAMCVKNVPEHITDQIRSVARGCKPSKATIDENVRGHQGVWKWHPMFKQSDEWFTPFS